MIILSIDPGTDKTGTVVVDTSSFPPKILDRSIQENKDLLLNIRVGKYDYCDQLVSEDFQCLGKPVGKTTFISCRWSGRFIEAWESRTLKPHDLIYRTEVKYKLCKSTRVKDKDIRKAILDLYGVNPIGTKKNPGPLYGVTSHATSALAVAIAHVIKANGNR